jgi:hypothetical protein
LALSLLSDAGGAMNVDSFESEIAARMIALDAWHPADAGGEAADLVEKLQQRAKVRVDDAGLDGRFIRLRQPLEGARP